MTAIGAHTTQVYRRGDAYRRSYPDYVCGDTTDAIKYANMRSAALFKASELDEFLCQAHAPDFQDTPLLGRVLTVELALRATDSTLEE